MPFDASGNFTRNYNFVQDASNGIKILAARVDGEFDNIATGMNLVFFRDGRVPMQADLRMNANGITGLKDGALGSPALRFNSDPNTGVYLPGLNQYGIMVNSVQRGVFTTTGFDVTGNFTATTGSIGGNAIMTVNGGNFNNNVSAPAFTTLGAGGGVYLTPRDATSGSPVVYSSTANSFKVWSNGADRLTVTDTNFQTSNSTQASMYVAGTEKLRADTAGVKVYGAGSGGATLQINDTASGSGANFQLVGNGGTTPNKTIRATAGNLEFVNHAYSAVIMTLTDAGAITLANNFAMNGSMLTVNASKWQAQHDGANAYVRSNTGDMYLGAGGNNTVQLGAAGGVTFIGNGLVQNLNGSGGTWNLGFSHQRAGRVGYHMYNGGGSCEWLIYQPDSASGQELRFATGVSSVITDRFKIASDGVATFNNSVNINTASNLNCGDIYMQRASAPTTGAIFFGNAGGKYLYYDGSVFQLSTSLNVGGNITSSSDIRLKSGVVPLDNSLALVNALNPKRFVMYGKQDLGLIAQEVEPVLPEVVTRDSKGYLSIDYGRLSAVLAGAVQTLDERLKAVEQLLGL